MTKRFCDRCGSEIKDIETRKKIKYSLNYSWIELFGVRSSAPENSADLCGECAEKFLSWLEGKETANT